VSSVILGIVVIKCQLFGCSYGLCCSHMKISVIEQHSNMKFSVLLHRSLSEILRMFEDDLDLYSHD
jgi:hypothetical protein